MSTLSAAWRRSQAISFAAKEEQVRLRHPEIDVEHLFLALLIVGGVSGKALGSLGVTLRDARAASERVHSAQIASLGVTPPQADPEAAVPDPWVGDFLLSDRAQRVSRKVDLTHDDRELLIALLEEPSGHVPRVLHALGVTEHAVRQAVECALDPSDDVPAPPRDRKTVTYAGYVPAPPDAVWALVSDPERRLEWDGRVHASFTQREDGVLVGTARETWPDGKPVKMRPEFRTTELVVSRYEPERLIEWEATWPLKPAYRYRRRFSIALQPDGTGTRIDLTHTRFAYPSLVARLLAPLARFSTKQALFAQATAISRALR